MLAVIALLYLTITIFEPFLLALLWAGVLCTVTYGTYERIAKRLNGRRQLASLYMTLLVLLLIVLPVVLLGVVLIQQASEVHSKVQTEEFREALKDIEKNAAVQWCLEKARDFTDRKDLTLSVVMREGAAPLTKLAAPRAVELIGDFLGFLFGFAANLFFILLALFYLYRDGPVLVRVIRELIPLPPESRNKILGEIQSTIVASVKGGLLTAVIQGALGLIILLILGLGAPVFWGFVMALAALIPLVGTALVWIPMAGYLALTGQTADAIVLVVYGVVIIASSDNVLRPLLIGRDVEVHPLLLFFGILGGIAVFGFVGIILGPVVVSFLVASSRLLRREFSTEEDAEAQPAAS